MYTITTTSSYKQIYKENPFKVMLVLIGLAWVFLVLSMIFPLTQYGIVPRTVRGLFGIIFGPFLHAGFSHLALNTVSLLIFGSIFIHSENKYRLVIFIQIVVYSGFGTWLFGRGSDPHIGASGIVYGLMGFVLVIGIFKRSVKTIIISVCAVIIVYMLFDKGNAIIRGIFPGQSNISWESHLSGLISGIILAYVYSKKSREEAQKIHW